eukprot:1161718-Pelagomonas_calceolata.AAC.6
MVESAGEGAGGSWKAQLHGGACRARHMSQLKHAVRGRPTVLPASKSAASLPAYILLALCCTDSDVRVTFVGI